MIDFQTFGCKVNTYDTGLLQRRLTDVQTDRPVVILNTCAVTKSATDEAIRTARRLKRKNPDTVIVMTGCSAQVDTARLEGSADLIVANSHKTEIGMIVSDYLRGQSTQSIYKSNIFKKEDFEPGGGEEVHHTRSFLKIQDGCDSFCTFCVIPFARGKSRSLSIPQLVERVNEIADRGVLEVVLTGVHIGDYGDGEKRLEDLIEMLLLQTSISRLRLTSLEPIEISDRLLDFYEDDRMCAHFHMSIQSANTKVLNAMKRKYTAQDVELSLNKISRRVPQAFVGMDVIAGFPGETSEDFRDTQLRLEGLPWSRLHVFPYSSRPGTFAARLQDAVPDQEIVRRSTVLRQVSHLRHTSEAEQQIGKNKLCLVLKNGRKALSRDYWAIQMIQDYPPGREVQLRIEGLAVTSPTEIALVAK